MENLNDLSLICRICLCKNDNMKDIFNEKFGDINISDVFNSITNFKVRFDLIPIEIYNFTIVKGYRE